MAVLATSVYVGGTLYPAGTNSSSMPAGVADEIRTGSAWVGGTAPALTGADDPGYEHIVAADLSTAVRARAALGLGTAALRDAREAPLNPLRYGAAGDGTTNDDAAFAAMWAALPTVGGHVYLPSGFNFRLTQPLPLHSGLRIEGGDCRRAQITNLVSDVFTVTGSLQDIHIHDLSITAGASNGSTGGVVFNCGAVGSTTGLSQSTFNNLYVEQRRPDRSTITAGVWLDNRMRDCNLNSTNSRSVPAIHLVSTTGSLSDNVFEDIRHTDYGGAQSTWVLWLEEFSTTTALGNTIRRFNFERPSGGAINLRGQNNAHLDHIWLWDMDQTSLNHLIFLDKQAGGRGNVGVTIERVARPSGTLGTGKADIFSAIGNGVGTRVRHIVIDGTQALRVDLSFDVSQDISDCYGANVSIQSYFPTVTVAAGGAAGTGATVTRAGNWLFGSATLATGTGTTAGDIVKVAWPNGMRSAPSAVILTAMSATAAAAGLYVSAVTTTDFTVAATTALPASTSGVKFAFSVDRAVAG